MPVWRVAAPTAGSRLDRALAARLDTARNQVQAWIRESRVTVNGRPPRPSLILAAGDLVHYQPRPKDAAGDLVPEPGELRLLHEDAELLVIDKPAGLAIHPGAGRPTGTLVHRLLDAFPELASVGGPQRPGIVHRLDIDTTGVLIVARSERCYQALTRAFAQRAVVKSYRAVVFGVPQPAAGLIELPIGRHPVQRQQMTVRDDGRPARTGYRTLDHCPSAALLELNLETGRTHQIRVHLKAIQHPLVGDATYAGNRWRSAPKEFQVALSSFPRPALHATTVALQHPISGEPHRFTAPMPVDLCDLWLALAARPMPGD